MRHHSKFYFLMFFLFPLLSFAQKGIRLNTGQAMDGYVLLENGGGTFLIDNCGDIVHKWSVSFVNSHPKLLPNGNLLFISNNIITEMNWEGTTVVFIPCRIENVELVYEVIKLPSGNYLCVGRKRFDDFESIGYNLQGVSPTEIDVIVEIDPDGNAVWEWNIGDHVIQERDSSLPNYGSIKDNPQLLNVDAVSRVDWNSQESFMINGIDYNVDLDLIAVSVRKISEVVIIDHSTTTAEASGSTGGFHGKGGDILYRWGNPENYERGTDEDRRLWFQHNPNWVQHGEHEGKMIIFNNGLDRRFDSFNSRFSSAPIIDLPLDAEGKFILEEDLAYGPSEPTIEYDQVQTNSQFFSDYTSSAKVIENGNVFVTLGRNARIVELNLAGEIVWEYFLADSPYIFRSEKYPLDYPAFEDKDLQTTGGTIEFPSSIYDCDLAVNTNEIEESKFKSNIRVLYLEDRIVVEELRQTNFNYSIVDRMGQRLKTSSSKNYMAELNYADYTSGLYFLNISNQNNQWVKTIKIVIQ